MWVLRRMLTQDVWSHGVFRCKPTLHCTRRVVACVVVPPVCVLDADIYKYNVALMSLGVCVSMRKIVEKEK